MDPMIAGLLKWSQTNPKKLFLIDGSGALLSAFLLGIILVRFEDIFGIPVSTLRILASLPCVFFIYDVFCLLKKEKTATLLKGIAYLNIGYCLVSIGLISIHYRRSRYMGRFIS